MKQKFTYHIFNDSDTIYRVSTNPNVCQFIMSANYEKWFDSCVDHLASPKLFKRISRDQVRTKYPHLFRSVKKPAIKPTSNFDVVMKEVCVAYNENTRNLDFRASRAVTVDEAVKIMVKALDVPTETTAGYNEFKPAHLRFLPDGSKVTLAREGSVAVYVTLPNGKTLNEKMTYTKMSADEYHNQLDDTVRLWWD